MKILTETGCDDIHNLKWIIDDLDEKKMSAMTASARIHGHILRQKHIDIRIIRSKRRL